MARRAYVGVVAAVGAVLAAPVARADGPEPSGHGEGPPADASAPAVQPGGEGERAPAPARATTQQATITATAPTVDDVRWTADVVDVSATITFLSALVSLTNVGDKAVWQFDWPSLDADFIQKDEARVSRPGESGYTLVQEGENFYLDSFGLLSNSRVSYTPGTQRRLSIGPFISGTNAPRHPGIWEGRVVHRTAAGENFFDPADKDTFLLVGHVSQHLPGFDEEGNKLSGDGQTVPGINKPVERPFVVQVLRNDAQPGNLTRNDDGSFGGTPKAGVPVSFVITSQPPGTVGASLSVTQTTTDANGLAQTVLSSGDQYGVYQVQATITNACTGSPLVFTAEVPRPDYISLEVTDKVILAPGPLTLIGGKGAATVTVTAVGWANGDDGVEGTADDFRVGPIAVDWAFARAKNDAQIVGTASSREKVLNKESVEISPGEKSGRSNLNVEEHAPADRRTALTATFDVTVVGELFLGMDDPLVGTASDFDPAAATRSDEWSKSFPRGNAEEPHQVRLYAAVLDEHDKLITDVDGLVVRFFLTETSEFPGSATGNVEGQGPDAVLENGTSEIVVPIVGGVAETVLEYRDMRARTHVHAIVEGAPHNQDKPAPDDADNDGIADAWEQANGLNPADATDAALDADRDAFNRHKDNDAATGPGGIRYHGDGLTALEEFGGIPVQQPPRDLGPSKVLSTNEMTDFVTGTQRGGPHVKDVFVFLDRDLAVANTRLEPFGFGWHRIRREAMDRNALAAGPLYAGTIDTNTTQPPPNQCAIRVEINQTQTDINRLGETIGVINNERLTNGTLVGNAVVIYAGAIRDFVTKMGMPLEANITLVEYVFAHESGHILGLHHPVRQRTFAGAVPPAPRNRQGDKVDLQNFWVEERVDPTDPTKKTYLLTFYVPLIVGPQGDRIMLETAVGSRSAENPAGADVNDLLTPEVLRLALPGQRINAAVTVAEPSSHVHDAIEFRIPLETDPRIKVDPNDPNSAYQPFYTTHHEGFLMDPGYCTVAPQGGPKPSDLQRAYISRQVP